MSHQIEVSIDECSALEDLYIYLRDRQMVSESPDETVFLLEHRQLIEDMLRQAFDDGWTPSGDLFFRA